MEIDEDTPTSEAPKTIKPLSKETSNRLCCGQVILSLGIAVKELIENAIDAGASQIEINLKDHGLELIEVVDNGSGITADNFAGLTLKGHTSKIESFTDLTTISTLGFRGEALNSLCGLSTLSVITRHKSINVGSEIIYDHKGNIVAVQPCARQIGTTVRLENLFSSLPVRLKEFRKNIKKEYSKMSQLLYAYCIIAQGITITCTNQLSKGPKNTIVSTQGSSLLKDNIVCVFGAKQMQTLLPIKLVEPDAALLEEFGLKPVAGNQNPFLIEGFISTTEHGQGRSSADRQFYYVNSRPCEPPKISKLVNETYRHFNGHQYPLVVLNVKIDQAAVDINVTPDKRQLFLNKEKLLLVTIKASLLALFRPLQGSYAIDTTLSGVVKAEDCSVSSSSKVTQLSLLARFAKANNGVAVIKDTKEKAKKKQVKGSKFTGALSQLLQPNYAAAKEKTDLSDASSDEENGKRKLSEANEKSDNIDEVEKNTSNGMEALFFELPPEEPPAKVARKDANQEEQQSIFVPEDLAENSEKIASPLASSTQKNPEPLIAEETAVSSHHQPITESLVQKSPEPITDSCMLDCAVQNSSGTSSKSCESKSVILETGIANIAEILESINSNRQNFIKKNDIPTVKFRAEIDPLTNQSAEKELMKGISKDMFEKMDVIGQFNHGFIIAKLNSDLFIVDQHATDEKYNFEDLEKTTTMENQLLIAPKPLELTEANECILIENLEIFEKNGFVFNIDESAPATKKIFLKAIPVSKTCQFDKSDIEELIFMLKDSFHTMCRPSKVRSMLASRACRKSVMIGTPLTKADMRKILDHMGVMQSPWNCPHGRPTIRHLLNLDLLYETTEAKDENKTCENVNTEAIRDTSFITDVMYQMIKVAQ